SQHPIIVRMPFDAKRGRFTGQVDTVYRLGSPDADYSVTADGGKLVFTEGIAEYDVLAGDFRAGLKGACAKGAALLHTASRPNASISADGRQVLIGRTDGSSTGERRWSVVPSTGGPERSLATGGIESQAFWDDSATVAVAERGARGWRFSLLDVRTNA